MDLPEDSLEIDFIHEQILLHGYPKEREIPGRP